MCADVSFLSLLMTTNDDNNNNEQEPTTSGNETHKDGAKTDFRNLPLPCKYENLQTEMLMSLKADFFEGARFDYNKQLNQKFFLSHGFAMTNAEIPAASGHIIKIPSSSYEFGANVVDTNYMLVGRVFTDGRVSGRVKYDATENLSFRLQTSKEREYSQMMLDVDVKGLDWQAQAKVGSGEFYGVNYIQSVTERVALGGEGFYLGANQGGKSGVGFAARYNDDDVIATAQVATTGMCSLTYCQKVGEKAMLASDFSWNWNHRQASGSVGYDYVLRQCRLRGSIDNQGVVGMFLEERLSMGLNLIFSAQIDHASKNHKFGYGMTVGE
jgi:mitochondrial import receptor subunit TOM40